MNGYTGYRSFLQRVPRSLWIALTVAGTLILAEVTLAVHIYRNYAAIVDHRLTDGRWKGPSRVYAQPVVLRPGLVLTTARVTHFLEGLEYEPKGKGPWAPGRFATGRDKVAFFPRQVSGAAHEPLTVSFGASGILSIRGLDSGTAYEAQTLEPQLLTFLMDENRDRKHLVRYDELPAHLLSAVLAIEDRRFFKHHGVDVVRIAGAAARNIEAESYAQGGSTITQQLTRSCFLHPDKTLTRKLQEALLAIVLEQRLTKQEILELYLNEVYLGRVGSFNIHGVGQGARTYFGKDVPELTLAESALLAGMIQSPNPYNPYRHPEEARARRDLVIRAMTDAGFIEDAAAESAIAEPLRVQPPTVDPVEAPYFVELAKEQIERSFETQYLARRNLTVQTSLDLPLQALAEDVLERGLVAVDRRLGRRREAPVQGALIVLEPSSGAVRAVVGGRSYKTSPFNRAIKAKRQPGSAFKPFVYLAAFEATFQHPARPAITPATIFEDVPSAFSFGDEVYAPRNNEGRYLGAVTSRRALASSLNVATVKVAEQVGYGAVAELWSKRLGAGVPIRPYPSLALGSMEATPLELAGAYNVLATGGLKVEPAAVLAVFDEEGRTLPGLVKPPERVVHEQAAFLVTDMLRSVLNEGTAYPVRERGFWMDAAGKTGTTNGSRDAWFAGYTPELLCVVWVGFDDNTPLEMPAAEVALPIWVDFMMSALSGVRSRRFEAPAQGVVLRTIDRHSGLLATEYCPARAEVFITGTEPHEYCPLHHTDELVVEAVTLSPE